MAATLCEPLGWVTLTGTAKIDACLEFLERLQAAGLLVLPARRPSPPRRVTPPAAVVEESPVHCALSALAPVRLEVFLEHALGDTEAQKQDCELRAFARLSDRLKTLFPRLPILLLLDGLYANGPVMQRCRGNRWQFMIVLKDPNLSTVWQAFHALPALKPQALQRNRGRRRQHFTWAIPWNGSLGSCAVCIRNLACAVLFASSGIPAPPPGSIRHGCVCSSPSRPCCNSNNLVRACPRPPAERGADRAGKQPRLAIVPEIPRPLDSLLIDPTPPTSQAPLCRPLPAI